MEYIGYVIWALAFFFTLSWTYMLIIKPDERVKPTICSVIFWWCALLVIILSDLSVFHLLWMFLVALLAPSAVCVSYSAFSGRPFIGILFHSSLIVLGTFAILIYLSSLGNAGVITSEMIAGVIAVAVIFGSFRRLLSGAWVLLKYLVARSKSPETMRESDFLLNRRDEDE